MFEGRARWSYGCDCSSCTTRRAEWHASRLDAQAANQREVDEIAVDRAVAGDPPARLTKAERVEVTRRLTQQGASAAAIARVLRVNPRSVTRYRTN